MALASMLEATNAAWRNELTGLRAVRAQIVRTRQHRRGARRADRGAAARVGSGRGAVSARARGAPHRARARCAHRDRRDGIRGRPAVDDRRSGRGRRAPRSSRWSSTHCAPCPHRICRRCSPASSPSNVRPRAAGARRFYSRGRARRARLGSPLGPLPPLAAARAGHTRSLFGAPRRRRNRDPGDQGGGVVATAASRAAAARCAHRGRAAGRPGLPAGAAGRGGLALAVLRSLRPRGRADPRRGRCAREHRRRSGEAGRRCGSAEPATHHPGGAASP